MHTLNTLDSKVHHNPITHTHIPINTTHTHMHARPEGRGFKAQCLRLSWWFMKLSDHYWLSFASPLSQPCSAFLYVSYANWLSLHTFFNPPCLWLSSVFDMGYDLLSRKSKIILPHIFSHLWFLSCPIHTSRLLLMCLRLFLWKPKSYHVVTLNRILPRTFSHPHALICPSISNKLKLDPFRRPTLMFLYLSF